MTIYIEGKPYEAEAGQNLLHACLALGFDIPYFCWHPAMKSVGACRQCAVKLYQGQDDTQGRIVMSCVVPVTEGMRVSIDDPEARDFRARIIELLMLNHPHDCPVCDEGGECHLQDMVVMTGHVYRNSWPPKRTFRNQDLGPFIHHEMNRCIHCYRCVRFYRDYAGGRDFSAMGGKDRTYFGRHAEGPLENIFSGNLVEVCPTGVFTDKTARRHYVRPWDLQTAPSVCVHCALGCNTFPGERSGTLRRIRNRCNSHVNGYFLCDRGRFGYEFVNGPERIRTPLMRDTLDEEFRSVTGAEAVARLGTMASERNRLIGIGSPRASLEANFALRILVGPDRFFAGVSSAESALTSKALDILQRGPARTPSLSEAASCDAVLVLGEDMANTAPMLALAVLQATRNKPRKIAEKLHIPLYEDRAVRDAVQRRHGPLFIATPQATWLDQAATKVYRSAPADAARLAFAVAAHIDPNAPRISDPGESVTALASAIAEALAQAERPLIVSGVSAGSVALLEASANVAKALCRTGRPAALSFVLPECNSMGLGLMSTKGLDEALETVRRGEADQMIILENDLFRRAGRRSILECFEKCRTVALIDHYRHEAAEYAHVVLPSGTFAGESGTLVSSEGRGQRFFQVFVPEGDVRPGWRWIGELLAAARFQGKPPWRNLDDIIGSLAEALPVFREVPAMAPPAHFRIAGRRIPRQAHRASGRTSLTAHIDIREPQPPDDPDSALAFSMEGYEGEPPTPLAPRFWRPGWNSPQAAFSFQAEIGGSLRGGDPGIRLIEPGDGKKDYYRTAPPPFTPSESFLIAPVHHIFGSDELASLAPAVAERAPRPTVDLHPEDAGDLGITLGEEAEITVGHETFRLTVHLRPEMPRGVAGLPSGFAGQITFTPSGWASIRKVQP